jgi:hypothetical protein
VIDIFASLLRPGEEYKTIDLPTSPTWLEGLSAHADHIMNDERELGVSSGTIYSYYFREVLSMGCIDVDLAKAPAPRPMAGRRGPPCKVDRGAALCARAPLCERLRSARD